MVSLYHPVKIGNIELKGNLFLAPVAGYSDRAFRYVCVENGACFTYTEMVSAEALVRNNQKTSELMARADNEKNYAVQIFGGNAEVMAEAAKIVLEKAKPECIDINCGCPVPKIIKTGAGSALTRDPERLYEVVKAVVDAVGEVSNPSVAAGGDGVCSLNTGAGDGEKFSHPNVGAGDGEKFSHPNIGAASFVPIPVTVKIRSGWDKLNLTWKEAADAALKAGAAAITMHPRTRAAGYEGLSDWGILKELVEFVDGRVPVFGSGDLFTPEKAKQMLEETGVDGVMFARGAMGNPFIFRDATSLLQNGSYEPVPCEQRIRTGFVELERLVSETNEHHACLEMRKRFSAYSKGIHGGAELRAKIVHASTVEDYRAIFAGLY